MKRIRKFRSSESKYGWIKYGWTLEDLESGFKKFYEEYGRYPLASDLEKSSKYLPSVRAIQARFGGIVKLRERLGLSIINYSKGSNRRQIAKTSDSRSKLAEKNIYDVLCDNFGKMFVHKQFEIEKTRKRIDFYVFTKSGNFGVDAFFTKKFVNYSQFKI